MKNIIIFLIIIIITLFFFTCTVNDFTGLIRVENHTDKEITNVRVGDTLISYKVSPGEYIDYWYSYNIIGKVTSESIDVNDTQKDTKYKFQPGYWVFITAQVQKYGEEEKKYIEISVTKQGSEQDEEWYED